MGAQLRKEGVRRQCAVKARHAWRRSPAPAVGVSRGFGVRRTRWVGRCGRGPAASSASAERRRWGGVEPHVVGFAEGGRSGIQTAIAGRKGGVVVGNEHGTTRTRHNASRSTKRATNTFRWRREPVPPPSIPPPVMRKPPAAKRSVRRPNRQRRQRKGECPLR